MTVRQLMKALDYFPDEMKDLDVLVESGELETEHDFTKLIHVSFQEVMHRSGTVSPTYYEVIPGTDGAKKVIVLWRGH